MAKEKLSKSIDEPKLKRRTTKAYTSDKPKVPRKRKLDETEHKPKKPLSHYGVVRGNRAKDGTKPKRKPSPSKAKAPKTTTPKAPKTTTPKAPKIKQPRVQHIEDWKKELNSQLARVRMQLGKYAKSTGMDYSLLIHQLLPNVQQTPEYIDYLKDISTSDIREVVDAKLHENMKREMTDHYKAEVVILQDDDYVSVPLSKLEEGKTYEFLDTETGELLSGTIDDIINVKGALQKSYTTDVRLRDEAMAQLEASKRDYVVDISKEVYYSLVDRVKEQYTYISHDLRHYYHELENLIQDLALKTGDYDAMTRIANAFTTVIPSIQSSLLLELENISSPEAWYIWANTTSYKIVELVRTQFPELVGTPAFTELTELVEANVGIVDRNEDE